MDGDYLTGPHIQHRCSAKLHGAAAAAGSRMYASSAQARNRVWRNPSHLHFFLFLSGWMSAASHMQWAPREHCCITYQRGLFIWRMGDQPCRFCFGPAAETVSTQVALKKRKNAMLWFDLNIFHFKLLCTDWLIDCFFTGIVLNPFTA